RSRSAAAAPSPDRSPARRGLAAHGGEAGHQAVQRLSLADHPELLPRRALLSSRVFLESVSQALQRVELQLEVAHGSALLRPLAAQREPVERAVLSGLEGDSGEPDSGAEADQAGPGHRPYRWRPG